MNRTECLSTSFVLWCGITIFETTMSACDIFYLRIATRFRSGQFDSVPEEVPTNLSRLPPCEQAHNLKVIGSNPIPATTFVITHSPSRSNRRDGSCISGERG